MAWSSNKDAAEHMRKRYQARKAAGLCPRCGEKPENGVMCDRCLKRVAALQRKQPIIAANLNHAPGLRERVNELLARKGFRRPEYVARALGITVDAATVLMFDGSPPID